MRTPSRKHTTTNNTNKQLQSQNNNNNNNSTTTTTDKVLGVAGQGTFGTVLKVYDSKLRKDVALKVIRSVDRYLDAARVEVSILKALAAAEQQTQTHSLCVTMYDSLALQHQGHKHEAFSFELLGCSLYEFIKHNKYQGFTMAAVRHIAHQLLRAVAFCHSIKLIHTDLKPENILLVDDTYVPKLVGGGASSSSSTATKATTSGKPSSSSSSPQPQRYNKSNCTDIRLIDFGGSIFDHEWHSRIINTRQYRSPEVLLGLPWSFPSDLFSVGCMPLRDSVPKPRRDTMRSMLACLLGCLVCGLLLLLKKLSQRGFFLVILGIT
jgi:serine/threonine protein kinase